VGPDTGFPTDAEGVKEPMKAVILSLLVAVGVFLVVVVLGFIIGTVISVAGSTTDPNGITSTPSDASLALAGEVGTAAIFAGVVLGAIAGIVFGVNRRQGKGESSNAER